MHDQNQPIMVPLLVLPSLFFGGVIGWWQLRRTNASWHKVSRSVGFLRGQIEVFFGLLFALLGLALSIPKDRSLPVAVPAILLASYFLMVGMNTMMFFLFRPVLSILDAGEGKIEEGGRP